MQNWRRVVLLSLVNFGGHLIWGWSKLGRVKLSAIQPQSILVLLLDEIGDVLLATPALQFLRRLFPGAKITVLVRRPGYEILQGNGDIDHLVLVDLPRFQAPLSGIKEDFQKIKNMIPLLRKQLGDKHFDLGIDLRSDLRTIYLIYKLPVNIRVAQAIRGGGFWLTHVAPYRGVQHEVERKLGIVQYLKPSVSMPSNLPLQMEVNERDVITTCNILRDFDIAENDRLAVVHPFAGWRPKEWPPERFTQVIDYLRERHGIKSVVIGSSSERARAEELVKLAKAGAVNLAGELNLKGTAAVIKQAVLAIGNDSGPMHIACAMQTPIVALFGQNTPARYGPWHNKNVTIYHRVECSPCAQIKCERRPSCLELITVAEVKLAVDKLLKK